MYDRNPFRTALSADDLALFEGALDRPGRATPQLEKAIAASRARLVSHDTAEEDAALVDYAKATFAELTGTEPGTSAPEQALAAKLVHDLGEDPDWAKAALATTPFNV